MPKRLNYCEDFIVYTQFTNVAARSIIRTWWAVGWTAILQRVLKKKLLSYRPIRRGVLKIE